MKKNIVFLGLLLLMGAWLYWKYRVPHTISLQNIALVNQSGEKVTLNDYSQNHLVVSIYASWCPPCMQELPQLYDFATTMEKDGFKVICITDEPFEKYKRLQDKFGDKIIFLRSVASREELNIPTIPTNFVFDKNRKLVYQKVGEEDWSSAEKKAAMLQLVK